MTLVERFIDFDRWTTSRKTALLMGIALPAQILFSLIARVVLDSTSVVDTDMLDVALLLGVAVVLACLFSGLLVTRAGREGRWTAYAVVAGYGSWLGSVMVMFGPWSTALLAWIPLVVVLVSLWYDARIGWAAFTYSIAFFVAYGFLDVAGEVPYAPVLLARSVDAQDTVGWSIGIAASVLGFFLYAFVLCVLTVGARNLQDVRLREAHRRLERSAQLIARYVPAQIAQHFMAGGDDAETPHERRRLTIFFSDLVGFTDISEELEPEDLALLLNEYFSRMTAIAHKHGGTVDELSGDAILVFFGAPEITSDQDHALRAVRMGLEMQQAMPGLHQQWRQAGVSETLRVRMGINTGVVTVGNFGSPDRMKYAVLGKHVNIAARIQANCQPGKLLLSHSTWLLVRDQISCEAKGEMTLKGISKPVPAYEPLSSTWTSTGQSHGPVPARRP